MRPREAQGLELCPSWQLLDRHRARGGYLEAAAQLLQHAARCVVALWGRRGECGAERRALGLPAAGDALLLGEQRRGGSQVHVFEDLKTG